MQAAAGVAKAPGHSAMHSLELNGQPDQTPEKVNTQPSTLSAHDAANVTTVPKRGGIFGFFNKHKKQPASPPSHDSASYARDNSSGDGDAGSEDIEKAYLEQVNTASTQLTSFEQSQTGNLYRDGQLVLCPAPTKDPRDPMNIPFKRKLFALSVLSLFGALAMSAELILGAVLPIFILQYSDANITDGADFLMLLTDSIGGFPAHVNPLFYLETFGGPPIWETYLLASAPILTIGVSSLILIPLAISCGRRPVILGSGLIAIAGAVWAGFTTTLGHHIGARVLQAFGAGTVESLIPFIVQDIVHVHERNTYVSGVFASQGLIIISLGIAAPYILVDLSWHWFYWITAIGAGFFLSLVAIFLPETRWKRSQSEMNGVPRVDHRTPADFEPRTWAYDLQLFRGKMEWNKGWNAFLDTLKTFFYPQIFFITLLNSAMISCALAAAFTISPALLTRPWSWKFLNLGLCLIPVIISALLVGILTGTLADKFSNAVAKSRGRRLPENQLVNLIVPTLAGLIGSIVFGVSAQHMDDIHWAVFLMAFAMLIFAFLGTNTIGTVYVLECYPQLAGPALVNIASFRWLFAFALSFKVSDWVIDLGYINSMVIYTGLIGFCGLLLPVVYIYGPAWRKRWPADRYWDDEQ